MADPIAQLSDRTVGTHRVVGYDEHGQAMEEKTPTRRSVKALDLHGNELQIPMCNHRSPSRQSEQMYGRPNLEELVKKGYLPKDECPLTASYRRLTGRRNLIPPKDGEEECEVTPEMTAAPDWHGCPHYIRERDRRREVAKAEADRRDRMTPQKAQELMLEQQSKMNESLVDILSGGRGRGPNRR